MPALVPVVDRLEDAPEAARTFYVAREGKFHLELNGAPVGFVPAADLAVANGRVVEFRDNNVALTKKVADLEPIVAKFKDIDPEKAREALAAQAALAAKGITKPDDVAAAIKSAVDASMAAHVKPLQDQLTLVTTTAVAERKRADEGTLRSALSDKFNKAGGKPETFDFVFGKAQSTFGVTDGVVKAAANQFSADRPSEPLSIDEWMTRQIKETPWAFKESGGGGAAPAGGGAGGAGGGRPGVSILKDPTPQQLGDPANSAAIKAGKMRVEYSQQA